MCYTLINNKNENNNSNKTNNYNESIDDLSRKYESLFSNKMISRKIKRLQI